MLWSTPVWQDTSWTKACFFVIFTAVLNVRELGGTTEWETGGGVICVVCYNIMLYINNNNNSVWIRRFEFIVLFVVVLLHLYSEVN